MPTITANQKHCLTAFDVVSGDWMTGGGESVALNCGDNESLHILFTVDNSPSPPSSVLSD